MSREYFFNLLTGGRLPEVAFLDISKSGKVLIISDLHMGSGSRDDLGTNGEMLISFLEDYYLKNGWILILNGDVEELQKHPHDRIQERWKDLYRIFNNFAEAGRLYKLAGNHDEILLSKRYNPYPLYSGVKIETGVVSAYVYHGHQLSKIYTKFNKFIGAGIRYFMKPFGIKNISAARNPYRRFNIEKAAYTFSMKNNCISIIGHTHRPLFESLGRFDYIKFEIERLCLDYPASQGKERIRIEDNVTALRKELGKLKRKEKRDVIRQSLYGDELPVPCLFNSGSMLGKKGVYAIELTNEDISLVYWFKEGKSKKFITRGGYKIDKLKDKPYCRTVLNSNRLDYIHAKIRLLGNN